MNSKVCIYLFRGQVELVRYILSNQKRLLPIFGSHQVLGGALIADLDGYLPIHRAESLEEVECLASHGADLWVPDPEGRTRIARKENFPTSTQLIQFLLGHSSLVPEFRNHEGLSHIDILLRARADSAILRQFIESVHSALVTHHTGQLLMEYRHRHDGLDALLLFRPHLPPDQFKTMVRSGHLSLVSIFVLLTDLSFQLRRFMVSIHPKWEMQVVWDLLEEVDVSESTALGLAGLPVYILRVIMSFLPQKDVLKGFVFSPNPQIPPDL